MKLIQCLLVFALSICTTAHGVASESIPDFAIVIHGGAGSASTDSEFISAREQALSAALDKGVEILKQGGSSLDAVEQVIRLLEDSPLFNAGRGGVLTAKGHNELDASIMDGKTRSCGAVGGVTTVKNPISLARLVMTETRHVLLVDHGADQFAKTLKHPKIEIVDPSYFKIPAQVKRLERVREKERLSDAEKMGTVGCVALDVHGNISAGTSTGGLVNKKHGRIGDSPIIGAGTYADNKTCGVSCTGVGEDFIRNSVAYDVSARINYMKQNIDKAVSEILNRKDHPVRGGIVGIDHRGNITMQFNTAGMSRAAADSSGLRLVKIGK